MKRNPMFNKDGQPTKRKFRVYCNLTGCKEYIIGKWKGGYGEIETKDGTFDGQNQVWYCNKHSELKMKNNSQKKVYLAYSDTYDCECLHCKKCHKECELKVDVPYNYCPHCGVILRQEAENEKRKQSKTKLPKTITTTQPA